MQIKNSPNFIRSFMVGLIASSAGALIALPSSAMPEANEVSTDADALAPTDVIAEPTAAETLPAPEVDAVEVDTVETEVSTDAAPAVEPIAEEDASEEMSVAEEAMAEEEDVAEADEAVEEPVAADEAVEEPIAEELATEEEDVAEADSEEATEEVVAEDADSEEVIAEDVTTEDAVTEDVAIEDAATEEVAAEEVTTDEVMAEDAVIEDVATEDAATEEITADEAIAEEVDAPIAEESLETPAAETTAEDVNTEEFTITELTGGSDSFEILAAALEAADLSEVLSGEGPYTVFAPTDEAFEALPEGAMEQLLLPENKNVLIQVLTYHVVPGAVLAADLETGMVSTVEGSDLSVEVAETVTINNANVIAADVTASNGVIHVIDSVILPPAPEADAEVEDETASAQ